MEIVQRPQGGRGLISADKAGVLRHERHHDRDRSRDRLVQLTEDAISPADVGRRRLDDDAVERTLGKLGSREAVQADLDQGRITERYPEPVAATALRRRDDEQVLGGWERASNIRNLNHAKDPRRFARSVPSPKKLLRSEGRVSDGGAARDGLDGRRHGIFSRDDGRPGSNRRAAESGWRGGPGGLPDLAGCPAAGARLA